MDGWQWRWGADRRIYACWDRLEFRAEEILDKPIDDIVNQGFANPPVKQLIAIAAQMRCSARSRPARIARR